ncbi:MAG: dihydropteroate synthase [Clostridia bacterium]|nr:dihydropteroate synthase [Clostridia bacterium]
MRNIIKHAQGELLVFDGAMGTELQKKGLSGEEPPELWNLRKPGIVRDIHSAFHRAGAAAITTNTFGGNRIKLMEYGLSEKVREINYAGVRLAREAIDSNGYVVGSIGPTGGFLEPLGKLSFDEAYDIFYEQAKALYEADCDAIILETMADLGEIRVALLAVKDAAKGLPVIASMTFHEDGRTLTGTDPETSAVVLESLGADAIGVNCGGGPHELEPVAALLCKNTNLPVLVEPNAGLPELVDRHTVFRETPEVMAEYAVNFASLGAVMLGSCCGSTPVHTSAIAAALKGLKPKKRDLQFSTRITSTSTTLHIGIGCPPIIVGERINPTGKKKLAKEIKDGSMNLIKSEALSQSRNGAHVLDINVGVPGVDEAEIMAAAVQAVQGLVHLPLMLDSACHETLERGLRLYHGKPIVNSVTGEEESMEKILPLIKRYGAAVVGLCMDEGGIPETPWERAAIAQKIVKRAGGHGIHPRDIFIDCLTLTASAHPNAALVTLESLKKVKYELGLNTILGVSNISFGLPQRSAVNSAFLCASLAAGLDAALINPSDKEMLSAFHAASVIAGRDKNAQNYIKFFNVNSIEEQGIDGKYHDVRNKDIHPLKKAIIDGEEENIVPLLEEHLAEGLEPEDILNNYLIPGIDEVGWLYDRREYFLPQLMISADTMQAAFNYLKPLLEDGTQKTRGTIIMATVKGDIHDIGKNIVTIMLNNHGFEVIDLGKNVSNDKIIDAARERRAQIIGLSALMTTTMPRMEEIIHDVRKENLYAKVIVGGAAVTNSYAREIGADGYGKDAIEAVKVVRNLLAETKPLK